MLRQALSQAGEVATVVDGTRKNLAFKEGNCLVHAVGPQVLDQAVLEGSVFFGLRDVPERSRMAFSAEIGLRGRAVRKQKGETVTNLILEERQGGSLVLAVGEIKGRAVACPRGAFVQVGDGARRVRGDSREVGPRDNATSKSHGSSVLEPLPDRCVGVVGVEQNRAH